MGEMMIEQVRYIKDSKEVQINKNNNKNIINLHKSKEQERMFLLYNVHPINNH